jgi:hypothetical protein
MSNPKLSTCEESLKDMDIAMSFEFNGARWAFVVRTLPEGSERPRVDVFEDGRPAGIGYLPPYLPEYPEEDGPMFDGSHSTPLGGVSLTPPTEADQDEDEASLAYDELLTRWAETLVYNWNLIAPGYRRLVALKQGAPKVAIARDYAAAQLSGMAVHYDGPKVGDVVKLNERGRNKYRAPIDHTLVGRLELPESPAYGDCNGTHRIVNEPYVLYVNLDEVEVIPAEKGSQ